jgi:hypothetical protein
MALVPSSLTRFPDILPIAPCMSTLSITSSTFSSFVGSATRWLFAVIVFAFF